MSFKDGAKVKVIKEIKALMEGMSLVQVKGPFVLSCFVPNK